MTGSSGSLGSSLVEYFFLKAHAIYCLQRNTDFASRQFWATNPLTKNADGLFEAVIHLSEENMPRGRWTEEKKQLLLTRAQEGTRHLIDYIATLDVKPSVFLSASAVGFYGDRIKETVDEKSPPGEGFLAELFRQKEDETTRLVSMGIRVVNLRFGLILSFKGGVLQTILPPFQACSGGIIGHGKQRVSWISMRDIVTIVDFIMQHEHIHGPVNVVSPLQTTTSELNKTLSKLYNRPAFLTEQTQNIRFLLSWIAGEMSLGSCPVRPRILQESGYEFIDPTPDDFVHSCINKEKVICRTSRV